MTSPVHIGEANFTPARGVGRKPNLGVAVLDAERRPLDPTTPAHARLLLRRGKAAVLRLRPFTLILKRSVETPTQRYRLGIDPGSRVTGMAVVREDGLVVAAVEVAHRGERIHEALVSRSSLRRRRRVQNLRHRKPRFLNRIKPKGWLPPSLESRISNVATWARRLTAIFPVADVRVEDVRFDMQLLQNPEISGVEYQRGELWGWEVRSYLLAKWQHACAYCGVKEVPLTIDHVVPRAKGGSDRISNLVIACVPCNQSKGARSVEEFLASNPERLTRMKAQLRAPLKDAAAVNSMRKAIRHRLDVKLGLPVTGATGGRTGWNRDRLGLPKAHWIDAACVGEVEALEAGLGWVLEITARGHGRRQMSLPDRHGFPRAHRTRQRHFFGFRTGDSVVALVPKGKNHGLHRGVVAVRAAGKFAILTKGGRRDNIWHSHVRRVARSDGYAICPRPLSPSNWGGWGGAEAGQ